MSFRLTAMNKSDIQSDAVAAVDDSDNDATKMEGPQIGVNTVLQKSFHRICNRSVKNNKYKYIMQTNQN